jgi:two-component system, NarL family, response regulator LiaR
MVFSSKHRLFRWTWPPPLVIWLSHSKGGKPQVIRVLIVDDHSVVREGLRMFLGRDPELARHLRPDVVLMDLLMPVMDGIAATAAIHNEMPDTEVIALTSVLESDLVIRAVKAGAIGYLLKDTQAAELRKAIKAAAAGQVQLSPQASAYLLRKVQAPTMSESLTEREMEVLRLLAQGKSNKDIARQLLVVEDTVKTHVRHILAKLGVQSRTQAVLSAARLGLVPLNQDKPWNDEARSQAWPGAPFDKEYTDTVSTVCHELVALGHDVEESSPHVDWELFIDANIPIWTGSIADGALGLANALGVEIGPDVLEAVTLASVEYGRWLTAVDLLRALQLCNTITRNVGEFFRSYDVLVTPAVATPPPLLRTLNQNDPSLDPRGWLNKLFVLIPFTPLFNVTGQPAINLPLGQSSGGLPIGVQLVGRYGDEATLFRLAAQLEQALPWADRHPSISILN